MKEKIVLEVTEDDNVTISEMSITGENFLYSIVCLVRYLLFNVTEKAVRGGD